MCVWPSYDHPSLAWLKLLTMCILQGRRDLKSFKIGAHNCVKSSIVSCFATRNPDDPLHIILYWVFERSEDGHIPKWLTTSHKWYTSPTHSIYMNNMCIRSPHGPQADFVRQIRVVVQKGDEQETGKSVHGYTVSVHA